MIFSFFFIFFLVELHVSCYFLFCRSYLKMRQELIQWSVCSISYFLTHSRSNILRRISNFYSGSSTSVIERLVFPFLSFPRLYLLCKSPNISSSFFKLNFRLPAHFIQNSQVQLHHDPEAQSRKLIPTLKI